VRDLSHQMLILKNTIDMLVVGQNGHTAMLERHRPIPRRAGTKGQIVSPHEAFRQPQPQLNDSLFSPTTRQFQEAMNECSWRGLQLWRFPGSKMGNTPSHRPNNCQTKEGPLGDFWRSSIVIVQYK